MSTSPRQGYPRWGLKHHLCQVVKYR
jgi:hypothetical protein